MATVLGSYWGLIQIQPRLLSWHNGETDIWGEPVFAARHPVTDADIARIHWDELHAQVIPAWTIALARADGSHDEVYSYLRQELALDPNVQEIISELNTLLEEDPRPHHRRIDYLFWAYNNYLEQRDLPYRLEASMRLTDNHGAVLSTRSYRVVSDVSNEDGARVRVLSRVDRTNVVEGFLGHAGRPDDGALVFFDRVLKFSTSELWPMLHEDLDERLTPTQQSFAPLIRRTVRENLTSAQFALLSETAEDQLTLLEVTASIHARHECGSNFRIWGLPYNGLSPQDQLALLGAVQAGQGHVECPEVTIVEAAQMVGASERLGSARGIEEAIEALAMLAGKAVTSHELTHISEHGRALECDSCEEMNQAARGELAAYVASLSEPASAPIALYQACTLSAAPGPHGDAVTHLRRRLMPNVCGDPEMYDLPVDAPALAERVFGRSLSNELPEDFPVEVAVLPRLSEQRYADALRESMAEDWEEDLTIESQ